MFADEPIPVSDKKREQLRLRGKTIAMLKELKAKGMPVDYDALLTNFANEYGLESGEYAEMIETLREFDKIS